MISIKTSEEIEIMRAGGKILSHVMKELQGEIKPGISTKELDRAAEALILQSGAQLAFKGYNGFPAAICTSVNEEVVHSVPSSRKILSEGDIITLDIGLIWKGYYLDMARTFPVGDIKLEVKKLLDSTEEALKIGIDEAKSGNTFGDIGYAVQKHIEEKGFNVVRELCGHGIGKDLHESPQITNYGKKKTGEIIKEGMVFCIEPMVTMGGWEVQTGKDGYSFETADQSLSAHFEDTVAITSQGTEVLTK